VHANGQRLRSGHGWLMIQGNGEEMRRFGLTLSRDNKGHGFQSFPMSILLEPKLGRPHPPSPHAARSSRSRPSGERGVEEWGRRLCKRRALHACVTHKSITRATPKKLIGGVRWLGSFGSVVVEKYGLGSCSGHGSLWCLCVCVCVCDDRLQKSMIRVTPATGAAGVRSNSRYPP